MSAVGVPLVLDSVLAGEVPLHKGGGDDDDGAVGDVEGVSLLVERAIGRWVDERTDNTTSLETLAESRKQGGSEGRGRVRIGRIGEIKESKTHVTERHNDSGSGTLAQ